MRGLGAVCYRSDRLSGILEREDHFSILTAWGFSLATVVVALFDLLVVPCV